MATRKLNSIENRLLMKYSRSTYVRSIGFPLFDWQVDVIDSPSKRKVVNGARQSGKSTVMSAVPCHTAKYYPGSLSIILAPTEKQANEDMEKVKQFIALDLEYPDRVKDSNEEIKLKNGSRIIVVTASERSARGFSKPRVVLMDEASRIDDLTYTSGVRAMTTNSPDSEIILISTPFGRNGFFFRAMSGDGNNWERYEVRSPYMVDPTDDRRIVPYTQTEDLYRQAMASKGVKAYFSPRHSNYLDQSDYLSDVGKQQYQQEVCCEFVATDGMVFSYEEIADALTPQDAPQALDRTLTIAPASDSLKPLVPDYSLLRRTAWS